MLVINYMFFLFQKNIIFIKNITLIFQCLYVKYLYFYDGVLIEIYDFNKYFFLKRKRIKLYYSEKKLITVSDIAAEDILIFL